MPIGSRPPTRSAPSAIASSSSSAVPGERRMPLCGKATISMVTRSRKCSRIFSTSWRFRSPSWLSMSTWLRMCSVPLTTTWRTRFEPVSNSGRVRAARTRRSASMRSETLLPADWLGTQGRPSSVLSRWMWTVDQRRQNEPAAEIDAVRIGRARCTRGGEEGGDPPALDLNVVPAAVGQRGVGETHASARPTRPPSGRLPCASAPRPRVRPFAIRPASLAIVTSWKPLWTILAA